MRLSYGISFYPYNAYPCLPAVTGRVLVRRIIKLSITFSTKYQFTKFLVARRKKDAEAIKPKGLSGLKP
jgi:hypothetical protein